MLVIHSDAYCIFTKYPYYKDKKDLDIVEKLYVFIRIYAITPNSKFGRKSPSSITGVGSFFERTDFAAMLLIFLVKTQTQTTSLKMKPMQTTISPL